jgi:hypothetical protein
MNAAQAKPAIPILILTARPPLLPSLSQSVHVMTLEPSVSDRISLPAFQRK